MEETLREWQATQARGAFAEIVEAASKGQPQLIRRRVRIRRHEFTAVGSGHDPATARKCARLFPASHNPFASSCAVRGLNCST
jgi:hypothetical protein